MEKSPSLALDASSSSPLPPRKSRLRRDKVGGRQSTAGSILPLSSPSGTTGATMTTNNASTPATSYGHNRNHPHHPKSSVGTMVLPRHWWMLWGAGLVCLATVSLLPIVLLEMSVGNNNSNSSYQGSDTTHHGVHRIIDMAERLRHTGLVMANPKPAVVPQPQQPPQKHDAPPPPDAPLAAHPQGITEKQLKPHYTLSDLPPDLTDWSSRPVARGVAGRPLADTPALQGAQRAHIDCDIAVDALAYWNDPVGDRDSNYVSPFASAASANGDGGRTQYITFTSDRGGWNNVRMSMEIIFVLAAATGRTLVLPPKEPLYLLNKDKEARHRGFADFFPLDKLPIEIISMKEFLQREAGKLFQLPTDPQERDALETAAEACDKRALARGPCTAVAKFLDQIGYNPGWSATKTCILFDESAMTGPPSSAALAEVAEHCGAKRTPAFWNATVASHDILHFPAGTKDNRLLNHYYGMIFFSDPVQSHFYKRFVRDYLHYHDAIYCAAGKVVQALQLEGKSRGFEVDDEGAGGYSAMHIRRGDLQYKRVKIPAAEWYENTKEIWQDREILYIATDERNKTFFDDLAIHYELRFLDNYWELAGLGNLDPNYMGMIDTIVASRGRAFAGTFFSTFTGYINRLRGYHGMSMKDSWYSFLPKKEHMHEWAVVDHVAFAFEWPDGWIGIDADLWPKHDVF